MKDLGDAAYILSIKIYRDRSQRILGLSKSTYIDKILRRFKMHESKKGFIPIRQGIMLSNTQCPSTPDEQKRMSEIPFASAVGSIMYAMVCTRPDVAYALSRVSRFQANPEKSTGPQSRWSSSTVKRSKDGFLVYGRKDKELRVTGSVDASFQTDPDDSRSQSGYVFVLNGGALSWKSFKQSTIAHSTTEAEYMAASEAAKEVVWIKEFHCWIRRNPNPVWSSKLPLRHHWAIAQAKEPGSQQRVRHVHRKYLLIRDLISEGEVKISKIASEANTADPLTKALSQPKHEGHVRSMGIRWNLDWN